MRGELLPVWQDMYRAVWAKLARGRAVPEDLFCELFRELNPALATPLDINSLADFIDDTEQARRAFRSTKASALAGEQQLVRFLQRVHSVCDDLGGDALSNRYFLLMEAFLLKYSIRYDLRRPFSLHPTLPGVFAKLIADLREVTYRDAALKPLMTEFEEAIRDISTDSSSGRIKTCIQKQFNLVEAMARRCPNVTTNTLGRICDQVGTWPHAEVRDAVKALYRFASDYPGIRHGGTAANALRDVDERDLVAVSVVMAGFAPYLAHEIDAGRIYRGAA